MSGPSARCGARRTGVVGAERRGRRGESDVDAVERRENRLDRGVALVSRRRVRYMRESRSTSVVALGRSGPATRAAGEVGPIRLSLAARSQARAERQRDAPSTELGEHVPRQPMEYLRGTITTSRSPISSGRTSTRPTCRPPCRASAAAACDASEPRPVASLVRENTTESTSAVTCSRSTRGRTCQRRPSNHTAWTWSRREK